MNRTLLLAMLPVCALVGMGCDPYSNYCNKMQQCADDDEDGYENIDPDDDYVAVCAEELRANERVLRANEEAKCHVAADAYRALIACEAWLDCDEIAEGDGCDDERDALEEANEDTEDDCATAGFVGCGATAPASLVAFLGVLLLRRRRPG